MSSTGASAVRQSGHFIAGLLGGIALGILALRWLSLDALWLLVLSALVVVVAGGKSARFLGLGVVGGVVAVGVFFVWLISTGFDDLDKMG